MASTAATPKYRAPLFTYERMFSAFGWLVLALLVWFIVIPAVRFGRWEPMALWTTWRFLLEGVQLTLLIGSVSVVLSSIFGFILALGRLSNVKLIRRLAGFYIEFVRALPSFLIIFYVFLGFSKLNLSAPTYAIIGLTLYTSAVMAEIFRAGILSVDRGQLEAAYALGLRPRDTVIRIILPQAIRRMMPAIVGQLVTLIKDTSLASVIAVAELTSKGQILYGKYKNVLEMMFTVAMCYFAICFTLSMLSKKLEVKDLSRA